MGSSGKKKTTFAKLARESKLRERRMEKQARKDARRRGEIPASRHEDAYAHELGPSDLTADEVTVGDAVTGPDR